VIPREALASRRKKSGVRLCWELEEPDGPKSRNPEFLLTNTNHLDAGNHGRRGLTWRESWGRFGLLMWPLFDAPIRCPEVGYRGRGGLVGVRLRCSAVAVSSLRIGPCWGISLGLERMGCVFQRVGPDITAFTEGNTWRASWVRSVRK